MRRRFLTLAALSGFLILAVAPLVLPSAVPVATTGSFSMIFMSDSQYPWWRGGHDPSCNTSTCTDTKATETNLDMAFAISKIMKIGQWPAPLTGDFPEPTAVVINGDLTEYWHPGQIEAVQAFYLLQPYPLYPGLGNHDYENNTVADGGSCYSSHGGVTTTDANRCAKQALAWMADRMGSLGVVNHDAPHFVSAYNDGAYIAEVMVTRLCNGAFTTYNRTGIGAGNTGTILIPPCAGTEVNLMSFKTGVGTQGPYVVDDFQTHPASCFRLTGTITSPGASRTACDARSLPPGGSGSMAYSWDVENYHFVQLHNRPSYTVELPAGGTPPVLDANAFSVTSSMTWLSADLAAAHSSGKHSVLLFHDIETMSPSFHNAINGKDVVAIFGGHIHNKAGQAFTISNGERSIPVFYSGSAECRTLIYAEFQPNKFNVGVIDATDARLQAIPSFNTRSRCDDRQILWEDTFQYDYPYYAQYPQLREFSLVPKKRGGQLTSG